MSLAEQGRAKLRLAREKSARNDAIAPSTDPVKDHVLCRERLLASRDPWRQGCSCGDGGGSICCPSDAFRAEEHIISMLNRSALNPIKAEMSKYNLLPMVRDPGASHDDDLKSDQSPDGTIIDRLIQKLGAYEAAMDSEYELDEDGLALINVLAVAFSPIAANEHIFRFRDDCRSWVVHFLYLRSFWIRHPGSWRVPAKPAERSISHLIDSFARHLFVRYPVPRHLLNNWHATDCDNPLKWLCWIIILGQGGSLFKASRALNWLMAKSLPAFLNEVPNHLNPKQGVMYAELRRLGCTESEYRRFSANEAYAIDPTQTRVGDFLTYWREAARWMARHRDQFSDEEADRILSWAMHVFSENARIGRPGAWFAWSGRKPHTTLAHAARYHEELARLHAQRELERFSGQKKLLTWSALGLGWEWVGPTGCRWLFIERLSSAELVDEGRRMRHCVAMYAQRCHDRKSAICSLVKGNEVRATIEVQTSDYIIIQAKGKCNSFLGEDNLAVIRRWEQTVLARLRKEA
jgi:hypothetical protein